MNKYRIRIETVLKWPIEVLAMEGEKTIRQALIDQAEKVLNLRDADCTFEVSTEGNFFVVTATNIRHNTPRRWVPVSSANSTHIDYTND